LESLLREDIYDEFDKVEREEKRLAKWVAAKWKLLVDKKKPFDRRIHFTKIRLKSLIAMRCAWQDGSRRNGSGS
jgi:hypothetical protein